MSLEARIARLEDRQAITDLIHAYARAVRRRRHGDCLAMMSEDAVTEVRHADREQPGEGTLLSRFDGKLAIAEGFIATAGESAHLWGMVHNIEIEIDGDEARAVCVMMAMIWPHGKEYVGEYSDRLRREAGGWRFSERVHTVFGDSTGRYAREASLDYTAAKVAIGDR